MLCYQLQCLMLTPKYQQDTNNEPTKPDLNIIDVNVNGTLYTWKLAVHYFRQQLDTPERDRCFIMTGSMVAWIDSPVCLPILITTYLTNPNR